jgi:hypothetical protein
MRTCSQPKCLNCEICIEKPACRWCRYYMPLQPYVMEHNELLDGDHDSFGQCRRRYPHLGPLQKNSNHRDPGIWPMVHDFEWCGDFTERTDLLNVSDTAVKRAEQFIIALLIEGSVANQIVRQKAREAGLHMNALLLASRNLEVTYVYERPDPSSKVLWRLDEFHRPRISKLK